MTCRPLRSVDHKCRILDEKTLPVTAARLASGTQPPPATTTTRTPTEHHLLDIVFSKFFPTFRHRNLQQPDFSFAEHWLHWYLGRCPGHLKCTRAPKAGSAAAPSYGTTKQNRFRQRVMKCVYQVVRHASLEDIAILENH